MKYILFLIIPILFKSQRIQIVDSLDNRPIALSKIIDNNNLYLTDTLGVYSFKKIPEEKVLIRASGYEDKIVKLKLNFNSIKLQPKLINIEEINLIKKNMTTPHIFGIKSKNATSFLSEKKEYAIEIKNETQKDCKVEQIEIPFKKAKNKKGFLLIDFYDSIDGKIGIILNRKNHVIPVANLYQNKIFQVNDNIYIHKNNAIFLAITWVYNTYESSDDASNAITFYSLPKGIAGKMHLRITSYKRWDTIPLIENENTKSSFIPAFRIITKCEK